MKIIKSELIKEFDFKSENFSDYGILIDQFNYGGFDMALIKSDKFAQYLKTPSPYQLAFKNELFSFEDMFKDENYKLNFPKYNNYLEVYKKFIEKLQEWVNQYGPIFLSSINIQRSKKYYSKLKFLGFKVKKREIHNRWIIIIIYP